MTTSHCAAFLRAPAVWLALAVATVAVSSVALGVRSGAWGWGGAPLLAAVAVTVSAALLAFASAGTLQRLARFTGPLPRKLETADGVRCFVLHKDSLLIGRSDCCDIVLPFKRVSTHHCYLHRVGNRWYVQDLDSLNGIQVNHRRVQRQRVRAGDVLLVADRELVFR